MSATKTFTLDEVAKHNTESDCYVIIHGRVYDVTQFQKEHPGGGDILLSVAGQDGTEGFEDIGHSDDAKKQATDLLVGDVEGAQISELLPAEAPSKPSTPTSSVLKPSIFFLGLGHIAVILVSLFFALVVIGLFSDPDVR